uniref:Uncharacterized protein n=1 Tax=Cannabis sativa TaxID=3483 RepID=A0A803P4K3_CANSA
MNPIEFWGDTHHIYQDLVQLSYEVHPRLRARPSSSSDDLLNSSFEDWEISSKHTPSPKLEVQHHLYPDQIRGEGYDCFIWELKKATLARVEKTHRATDEEDTVGDIEVQKVEDPGKVRPTTLSNAKGNEEEGVAQVLPFRGYNDEGEPVFEGGDVLEAGKGYIIEEYTEAHPLRRIGSLRDRWISPPSVVTMKK